MQEPRVKKVAKILVEYSTKVKKGEVVQIVADNAAQMLALEIYKLVLQKGAYPLVHLALPEASYHYYKLASDEQLKHFPKIRMYELKNTDVVIYIGAPTNLKELSSINPKKISMRQKVLQPLQQYRVNNTRWIIFYYPTAALAQEAEMSITEFRRFVFGSAIQNWEKEAKKLDSLKKAIDKGSHVRIKAKNTDLSFSIKGRTGKKCCGEFNMPDGEVFTAPVEDSVNGIVEFSYPAIYSGKEVDGIYLVFEKGKVIKARAKKNYSLLKAMLETDKGSRTLGEFGIGTNYKIKKFTKNILFDEKIGGTIHLALGSTYKETGGKNKSAIHWDLLLDLRKGGELYVDGKLIQKNGKFLI